MNQEIIRQLGMLSCTQNEAEVFIALLPHPKGMGVLQLSRALNTARATLYGQLDTLVEKGLVRKGAKEGNTLFFAENTNTIESLFDERKQALEGAKHSLLDTLKNHEVSAVYNPKFTIYDNQSAAETILRDVLRSREKEIYWFWRYWDSYYPDCWAGIFCNEQKQVI